MKVRKEMIKRIIVVLGVVFLICGLISCGTLKIKHPNTGETIRTDDNEALVFGKMTVLCSGCKHEYTPWKFKFWERFYNHQDPWLAISLYNIEQKRGKTISWKYSFLGSRGPFEGDGRFYCILPAGTYLLCHSPKTNGDKIPRVLYVFQVPSRANVVYLGNIVMEISGFSLLFDAGLKLGKKDQSEYYLMNSDVTDNYEAERNKLLTRYPNLSGPITKNIGTCVSSFNFRCDCRKGRCDEILDRCGFNLLESIKGQE